jgi:hypothetical protein
MRAVLRTLPPGPPDDPRTRRGHQGEHEHKYRHEPDDPDRLKLQDRLGGVGWIHEAIRGAAWLMALQGLARPRAVGEAERPYRQLIRPVSPALPGVAVLEMSSTGLSLVGGDQRHPARLYLIRRFLPGAHPQAVENDPHRHGGHANAKQDAHRPYACGQPRGGEEISLLGVHGTRMKIQTLVPRNPTKRPFGGLRGACRRASRLLGASSAGSRGTHPKKCSRGFPIRGCRGLYPVRQPGC